MNDEDEILAIVAALEFLESRDEAPPPRSKWRDAARALDDAEPERVWKNS